MTFWTEPSTSFESQTWLSRCQSAKIAFLLATSRWRSLSLSFESSGLAPFLH